MPRIVLAIALLLAGAGFLLTRSYEAPGLGEAALEKAGEATGLRLSARAFRFRPLRRLELADVRATARFPGGDYDVALRSLRLEHRLAPLLVGRVAVESVVLVEPRMVLTIGPVEDNEAASPPPRRAGSPEREAGGGARAPALEAPPTPLDFALSEMRIEDGDFLVRDRSDDPDRLSIQGLSLALESPRMDRGALTMLHGLEGAGRLSIDGLRFARTEVSTLSARVEASEGRVALSDLGFELGVGSFLGELSLDFNTIPFRYALSLTGGASAPDAWEGRASIQLDASGFGTVSRDLTGEGTLDLPPGEIPAAPWVRAVEARLDDRLVGLRHRGLRARFRVDSNLLSLERLEVEAAPYSIELEGNVDLEGPLHLRLALTKAPGVTPRRFRLFGTLAAPELEEE